MELQPISSLGDALGLLIIYPSVAATGFRYEPSLVNAVVTIAFIFLVRQKLTIKECKRR
jgi:hypothetical protein